MNEKHIFVRQIPSEEQIAISHDAAANGVHDMSQPLQPGELRVSMPDTIVEQIDYPGHIKNHVEAGDKPQKTAQ